MLNQYSHSSKLVTDDQKLLDKYLSKWNEFIDKYREYIKMEMKVRPDLKINGDLTQFGTHFRLFGDKILDYATFNLIDDSYNHYFDITSRPQAVKERGEGVINIYIDELDKIISALSDQEKTQKK